MSCQCQSCRAHWLDSVALGGTKRERELQAERDRYKAALEAIELKNTHCCHSSDIASEALRPEDYK